MIISKVAKIVADKIDSNKLTLDTYVSTENLNPNFGGVNLASNLPTGQVSQVKPNDILISNIRPYFKKIWFSTIYGGCSTDVICLRVFDNKIKPRFLFYLLNTDDFINTYVSSSKGTKMPRGDKNVLLNYDFELPLLEIQQHIVDTIGSIDNLIESNAKLIEKLKLIGAYLYAKSDKESVLVSSLNIQYGTSIPKLKRSSGEIQMYGANGIIDFIDEHNTKDANIIFGCRGKVGDVYYSNKKIFVLNTAFYLNVPPDRLGDYYFSIKNISGFADYATGAAQPQITLTEIKNIYIDISNNPSLNFIINMIIKLEDQNILLNNQKSVLLSKFF